MSSDKKKDKLTAFFSTFSDTDEQLDFRLAHETAGEKMPVIPTGSYALDDALSSGGLPLGRLIQYYGAPGSGKTLMAMLAIKEAQKIDPSAQQMFIDAEGTFDPNWAEMLGLDTARIILVEGDRAVIGRNCFEMILGVPKEDKKTHLLIGKSKEGLLDKIMDGEFNINMVVIDSLGSIIPPGEDTSAVGKMNISLLARFLTTTFRKLSLDAKKAKVPFIFINHKKSSMDPYGADHTYSGGNSYSHYLSANVYFEAIQRADAQILDEKDQKIGHTMRATVEKSKMGSSPKRCEFKVNFSIGVVDRHEEIAQLAIDYNVVQKTSTVTHEYGDQKWVGFPKFCEAVRDNPDLATQLLLGIEQARDNKRKKAKEDQEARTTAAMADIDADDRDTKRARKGAKNVQQ